MNASVKGVPLGGGSIAAIAVPFPPASGRKGEILTDLRDFCLEAKARIRTSLFCMCYTPPPSPPLKNPS